MPPSRTRPDAFTRPLPPGCSMPYARMWRRAEAHLRNGGAMEIDLSQNWDPDEMTGFRDRLKANRHQADIPTIPPPAGCSDNYALGWQCAEDCMRDGMGELCDLTDPVGIPPGWSPEEAAGFRDRVARGQNPDGGQVLPLRPRT
jgi:hypothetical protein